MVLRWAEKAKLEDRKESASRRLVSYQEGEVTKPFENTITCHNDRVDATKSTSPINPYNPLSTFLLPLAFRQCQLRPCRQGRVGCPP